MKNLRFKNVSINSIFYKNWFINECPRKNFVRSFLRFLKDIRILCNMYRAIFKLLQANLYEMNK